jgi:WD40 repeat protein
MEMTCLSAISDHSHFRVVGIHPNEFAGVIGEHGDFPIEEIKLNHNKELLASCSHDCQIKFWDVKDLLEGDDNTEDNEESKDDGEPAEAQSESEVEDSSDEECAGKKSRKKKRKASNNKKPKNDFFADL